MLSTILEGMMNLVDRTLATAIDRDKLLFLLDNIMPDIKVCDLPVSFVRLYIMVPWLND
jgi:hypothetical protein